MKTLQDLALQAFPDPALMARTFLVPWYPLAQKLEARNYEEQRNKFREQHRVHFRYVCEGFRFIQAWYSDQNIYPSNVSFLDKYWTRCFGSRIQSGWLFRPKFILCCCKRVFRHACWMLVLDISFLAFRNVVNQIKQLKELSYCRKTKWVHVQYEKYSCLQCPRIRTNSTLDGIRLKMKRQFVDKNQEEAKMRQLYFSQSRCHLQF